MSLSAELWCAALENAERLFNAALQQNPDHPQTLTALNGKVLAIDVDGLALTIYCLAGTAGMTLLSQYPGEVHARLRGRPFGLLRLATTSDTRAVFADGEVSLSGDTDVAQHFQTLIQHSRPDWEEQLSKLVGDVMAHQLGNLWRDLRQAAADAGTRSAWSQAEYLRYELTAVPDRAQVETFSQAVETLRDDIARLSARLDRLSKRPSPNTAKP